MISMRGALLTATLFLITAISLSGVLPLWLDEVLQLVETRQASIGDMLATLPRNSGAAPLGYLVQHATLEITGYSARRARLPAALFGAGAVFAVALLGAELGLKRSWTGALIFAAFPLTLRYATESRVYSQALFFSVVATLVYVRLARRPAFITAGAYWLALTAAAYTQPYAASVGLAHLAWSVAYRERKTGMVAGTAFALTTIAFLPWYLWSRAAWSDTIESGALHFSLSAKTPLMLFRELTGAGYWGSGLLVVLCALAIRERCLASRAQTLLILLVAVPLVSVFAANALFDYFLAARQFIWVLPAVAILAAAALERPAPARFALAAVLGIVCVWQTIQYFTAPRENWEAAATFIAEEVGRGACLAVAPAEHAFLYEHFQPKLRRADDCGDAHRVMLVITPYTTGEQQRSSIAALISRGYKEKRRIEVGRSVLVYFDREL